MITADYTELWTPGAGNTWNIVNDDFGDKGRAWNRADPSMVSVESTGLTLRSAADHGKRKGESGPWLRTGVVYSQRHFMHGYFEAIVRWPYSRKGAHGCFWLQTTEDYIPGQAEIDIAEYFGNPNVVHHAVHWRREDQGAGEFVSRRKVTRRREGPEGFDPARLMRYGLLWLPDRYEFYVQRRRVAVIREGLSDRPKKAMFSMLMSDFEADDLSGRLRDYRMHVKSFQYWDVRERPF